MALVELNQVRREFDGGRIVALHGVSLAIEEGETLAIVGPSGSGKSTLLNLLCGLDHPTSGEVKFEGRPVTGRLDWRRIRARHVGIVFQSFCLLPELTARENIEVAISTNLKDSERRARSLDLLEAVGLAERADNKPPRLSGGERQRWHRRALINRPRLMLADEPTGNLDQTTGRHVLDLLMDVVRSRSDAPMITHEPSVAACCGRHVKIVDGRIVSDHA
jgi:putative ABC transport system ATP-binding protein